MSKLLTCAAIGLKRHIMLFGISATVCYIRRRCTQIPVHNLIMPDVIQQQNPDHISSLIKLTINNTSLGYYTPCECPQ